MYNLFYYKVYGKDRQHEKESVPGSVSLDTADLYRILIFRNVLWIYDAEQRIFFCLSAVYEYVHLCRLHGICDSQSAVVSLSSPVSLSAGIDGQCQALVLWNLHAG